MEKLKQVDVGVCHIVTSGEYSDYEKHNKYERFNVKTNEFVK